MIRRRSGVDKCWWGVISGGGVELKELTARCFFSYSYLIFLIKMWP